MPVCLQRLALLFTLGLLSGLPAQAQPSGRTPCVDGYAGVFPCRDVDLMAFVPIADLGGAVNNGETGPATLNDLWGWTDSLSGREYALVGRSDGTAFVDVSDPERPAFLGLLPRTPGVSASAWRDIKVYAHHAFIVSEATGHGMQVFDLTALRGLAPDPDRRFEQTAHYDGISRAHNLVINETTARGYAVGTTGAQIGAGCGQGLHIVDLSNPARPQFLACHHSSIGRGYTHDAQCVRYHGPDERYAGREICISADEAGIAITDVTEVDDLRELSTLTYPSVAYAHQGWLSEDHRYFFADDELDERNGLVPRTRTLVFDLLELDSPTLLDEHLGVAASIDHNQYVVGTHSFQANYTSGLRILDVSDPAHLAEVAFFDTFVEDDRLAFLGLWSVYPFFSSGNVIVSDIGQGLFVLRPTRLALAAEQAGPPAPFMLHVPTVATGEVKVTLDLPAPRALRVALYDVAGRQMAVLADGAFGPGAHTFTLTAELPASGLYFVRATSGPASRTHAVAYFR